MTLNWNLQIKIFFLIKHFYFTVWRTIQKFKLISADCSYGSSSQPAWHNDPELAGGRVLLRDCYEIVDFFVGTFGLPEQVYCLATNNAEDKQRIRVIIEGAFEGVLERSELAIEGVNLNIIDSRRQSVIDSGNKLKEIVREIRDQIRKVLVALEG